MKKEEHSTVSSILDHLQYMRHAVPVNYKLKAELKERLLRQMAQQQVQETRTVQSVSLIDRRRILFLLLSAFLLLALLISLYRATQLRLDEEVILPVSSEIAPQTIDIDPSGDWVMYVQNGKLSIVSTHDSEMHKTVPLPGTDGTYVSFRLGHGQVFGTLIEQSGEKTRVWAISRLDAFEPQLRLLWEGKGNVNSATATDREVFLSREVKGQWEIWRGSAQDMNWEKLGSGKDLVMSPSGTWLAFERSGSIYVYYLPESKEFELGKGKRPSFLMNERLSFLTENGMAEMVYLSSDENPHTAKRKTVQVNETVQFMQWVEQEEAALLAERTENGWIYTYGKLE